MRQPLQPVQWALVSGGGYHATGYEVVPIPPHVHAALKDLVADHATTSARAFGGPGEPLEDVIIFGRTKRIRMPQQLQHELREAFRPLVSTFCSCALEDGATVGGGGIRVYHRGASLAAHLDWAHKFVVSATLNVKQSSNGSRWPLHMHAFGAAAPTLLLHEEGQAVLYEGSRLLHSRPHLEDESYAAAFVGFVPRDYPAGRRWLTRLFVGAVRRSEGGG